MKHPFPIFCAIVLGFLLVLKVRAQVTLQPVAAATPPTTTYRAQLTPLQVSNAAVALSAFVHLPTNTPAGKVRSFSGFINADGTANISVIVKN